MKDFAIGMLFASGLWFGVTASIAGKCSRRVEALSRYIGALEVEKQRLAQMFNGISGRELTVIKGGQD